MTGNFERPVAHFMFLAVSTMAEPAIRDYASSNPYATVPPSGPPESAKEPTAASLTQNAQPNGSLNSNQAEALGAHVHRLNPDASPEEKAASLLSQQAKPVQGATVGRTNVGHGTLHR
jgi:hypothetical protein